MADFAYKYQNKMRAGEAVKRELGQMAAEWQGPPPLPGSA